MAKRSKQEEATLMGFTEEELDPTNPGAMVMGLAKRFGVDAAVRETALGSAGREIGFALGDRLFKKWADAAVDVMAHMEEGPLKDLVTKENAEPIKLIVHKGIDGIIVCSESGIGAVKSFNADKKLRAEVLSEMQEYVDAGLPTIRKNAFEVKFGESNKVIANLEESVQASFNSDMAKSASDILVAGAQYYSRHMDMEARREKAADHMTEKYKDKGIDDAGLVKPQKDVENYDELNKQYKQSLDDITTKAEESAREHAEKSITSGRNILDIVFNREDTLKADKSDPLKFDKNMIYDKEKIYNMSYVNKSSSIYVGSALVGGQAKDHFEGIKNARANKVLAYDLIQYLNEAVKEGSTEKCNGVDLTKFRKEYPKHQFQSISKDQNTVDVKSFIKEIFLQHLADEQQEGISARYDEQFDLICSTLADAIEGNDLSAMTGETLHPLALIKLVGEEQLVKSKGASVANEDVLMDELREARTVLPMEKHQIDPHRYANDLGMDGQQIFAYIYDDLPDKAANFMTLLMPTSVLAEAARMDHEDIYEMKQHALPEALDNLKDVLADFNTKTPEALKDAGLSSKQIELVQQAHKHAEQGNNDKLSEMLQDKSKNGLSFALLTDHSYWDSLDIMNGVAMGDLANPNRSLEASHSQSDEQTLEAEFSEHKHDSLVDQAKEALNNIAPFKRGENKDKDDRDIEVIEAEIVEDEPKQERPKSHADRFKRDQKSLAPANFKKDGSIAPENFSKDSVTPQEIIAQREASAGKALAASH